MSSQPSPMDEIRVRTIHGIGSQGTSIASCRKCGALLATLSTYDVPSDTKTVILICMSCSNTGTYISQTAIEVVPTSRARCLIVSSSAGRKATRTIKSLGEKD